MSYIDGIQEAVEQRDVVLNRLAVCTHFDDGDVLPQHRVTEAIHHVGELGGDARVDVGRGLEHEGVDVRLHHAAEFLEHQMLVFHLVGEAADLEQALAVPVERLRQRRDGGGIAVGQCGELSIGQIRQQPFVDEGAIHRLEGHVLGVLDDPVVLGVEHLVHRSQRDVLVGAAVAGDEVPVEQFVVVGGGSALALGTGGTVGIGVAQGASRYPAPGHR